MEKKNTIQEEINYIYFTIQKYINKWEIKKLVLINNNTKEDTAFIAIYNYFKKDLPPLENIKFIEEINFLKEKVMLINTDTILKKETSLVPIITPFTLNIFADYTPDFINEILFYFEIKENFVQTQYDTDEKLTQLIYDLLKGEKKFEEITEEEKKKLSYFFREKNRKTNCKITNSYNKELFKNYYLGIFD